MDNFTTFEQFYPEDYPHLEVYELDTTTVDAMEEYARSVHFAYNPWLELDITL